MAGDRLKIIINALSPGAWQKVGGRLLVERAVIDCGRMALENIVVLVPGSQLRHLEKLKGLLPEDRIVSMEDGPSEKVPDIGVFGERYLYIDARHLIDPRLIEFLLNSEPTTIFALNAKERQLFRIALFDHIDLEDFAKNRFDLIYSRANILEPAQIEHYNPEIRGDQEPYLIPVTTFRDAVRATWALVTMNQKKVMDLPSQYIDPPFENALTFALCYTPVTPNQVTVVNLLIAFVVGCLFWSGHFVAGAFLTYAAEILDGVDGKLARAKVIFSRFGEYECYIDFLYEHWWYIAIAFGLRQMGYDSGVWWIWGLLAVSDVVDNMLYTLSEKWFGKSLDLLSPFDASFRRIAGRRNIYAFIFLAGFILGYPCATFLIAAMWAAVTASIHTVRLTKHRFSRRVAAEPLR